MKARGHKSTRTLVLISFIFHTRSNKTWQVIHMIYVGGFTVPIFFFFFGSASLYHFWINWIGFFFGHTQFFFVTNSTWLSNVRKNRHNYTPWIHRNYEILGMRVKKYVDFTTMNWTLWRFLLDLQIKHVWSNQVIKFIKKIIEWYHIKHCVIKECALSFLINQRPVWLLVSLRFVQKKKQ